MAIGHQSFYQTALTSGISASDLIIPLDTVPTVSEGFLVIESTVQAKREIIYFTSKDATTVTCPSGAGNGRGYDGTTAVAHLQGATVIMAPVGAMFEKLGDITVNSITIADTTSAEGWSPLGDTPDTVTANGNKSYDLVFNSNDLTDTITPGMRLRTARTVAAPDQCTSLNGSTQYYSRTSANLGSSMTFTDDFSVSAWVKLSEYDSTRSVIASRFNNTSGWWLIVNNTGQIELCGFNASGSNFSRIVSYQSILLNKWVHISAQLDMSAFTATPTTSYVMLDGVDVPASVSRGGTNPTALIQAGNLEIGSFNGGTDPFTGKIAQVAVYSAKVLQATHLAAMNQGLAGTETSLISAYSFDGVITDLASTGNDLTANGGVLATTTDSPFGNSGASTTLEYATVMSKPVYSGGNTTMTVQTPEGCAIPTSGGISSVDYSSASVPYGFPRNKGKWELEATYIGDLNMTSTSYVNTGSRKFVEPIGSWRIGHIGEYYTNYGGAGVNAQGHTTLSTGSTSESDSRLTAVVQMYAGGLQSISANKYIDHTTTAQQTWYLNKKTLNASVESRTMSVPNKIYAENAYI